MIKNEEIYLRGLIAAPDGSSHKTAELRGAIKNAEEIGIEVGKMLQ